MPLHSPKLRYPYLGNGAVLVGRSGGGFIFNRYLRRRRQEGLDGRRAKYTPELLPLCFIFA